MKIRALVSKGARELVMVSARDFYLLVEHAEKVEAVLVDARAAPLQTIPDPSDWLVEQKP